MHSSPLEALLKKTRLWVIGLGGRAWRWGSCWRYSQSLMAPGAKLLGYIHPGWGWSTVKMGGGKGDVLRPAWSGDTRTCVSIPEPQTLERSGSSQTS